MLGFRKIGARSPFNEYTRVYHLPIHDSDTDMSWLRKQLLLASGLIYISTDTANHEVYNQLEEDIRSAVDDRKAEIHFLAGPIVSIPSVDGLVKLQKGRESLNSIVRLTSERKITLYPSPERRDPDYRVFCIEATVNSFEHHPLGATPDAWYFYYHPQEATVRKKDFLKAVSHISPVTNDFLKHFLFLTDEETALLRYWAKKNGIDANHVKLEDCMNFWKQLE